MVWEETKKSLESHTHTHTQKHSHEIKKMTKPDFIKISPSHRVRGWVGGWDDTEAEHFTLSTNSVCLLGCLRYL